MTQIIRRRTITKFRRRTRRRISTLRNINHNSSLFSQHLSTRNHRFCPRHLTRQRMTTNSTMFTRTRNQDTRHTTRHFRRFLNKRPKKKRGSTTKTRHTIIRRRHTTRRTRHILELRIQHNNTQRHNSKTIRMVPQALTKRRRTFNTRIIRNISRHQFTRTRRLNRFTSQQRFNTIQRTSLTSNIQRLVSSLLRRQRTQLRLSNNSRNTLDLRFANVPNDGIH